MVNEASVFELSRFDCIKGKHGILYTGNENPSRIWAIAVREYQNKRQDQEIQKLLIIHVVKTFATHPAPFRHNIKQANGIVQLHSIPLFRPRLSPITAYLKVKIWSLF